MTVSGEDPQIATELSLENAGDGTTTVPRWHGYVALTTLVLAMLAAVNALASGITANNLLLDRTEELGALTLLESQRVDMNILDVKHGILLAQGLDPEPAEVTRVEAFHAEYETRRQALQADEATVGVIAQSHQIFSIAGTILAIAIVVTGMAVIMSTRWLWIAGAAIGMVGLAATAFGVISLRG